MTLRIKLTEGRIELEIAGKGVTAITPDNGRSNQEKAEALARVLEEDSGLQFTTHDVRRIRALIASAKFNEGTSVQKVVRDTTTGEFVEPEQAKADPKGTVTETVHKPRKAKK